MWAGAEPGCRAMLLWPQPPRRVLSSAQGTQQSVGREIFQLQSKPI